LNVILERISVGETIALKRFGVFSATISKGKKIKTPLFKGGEIQCDDSLVIRFRQSLKAKELVNAYYEMVKEGFDLNVENFEVGTDIETLKLEMDYHKKKAKMKEMRNKKLTSEGTLNGQKTL
jgi:nucleoid DNA-binding protein